MELVETFLPPGVINIVNGFDSELGRALVLTRKFLKLLYRFYNNST
jgi:aldehyde dehydrogenase